MKKFTRLFLMVVLLSSAHFSFSQIGFGPRVGLNLPVLVGINTNAQFKPGICIGGYAKLNMGDKVAFQPELLFSMKGYSYSNSGQTLSQSLNYVDIPLMFNFGKSQGVHFLLGAQPSILLGAQYKYKSGSGVNAITTNNKSSFKGLDMGLLTGLGYQLESGLNFDFRFSYGFMSVYSDAALIKLHNVNLQFTVGKTFGM
jgi:hypothetical protein